MRLGFSQLGLYIFLGYFLFIGLNILDCPGFGPCHATKNVGWENTN